jgi:hypothetical protein
MIAPAQDNIALAARNETHDPTNPSLAIYKLWGPFASFAALIGVSVTVLWICRGTPFHQFAIGIVTLQNGRF